MNPSDPRPESKPALAGVVFRPEHQAGLWRRVIASLVDLAVLYVLYAVLFNLWLFMTGWPWIDASTFPFAATFLVALYIGPLKRSRLRSVGYRLAGVRIVNLRGDRPSLPMMLIRGPFYLLGLGFVLIDFAWLLGQRPRQKLTDLMAGTYVVRAGAQPMGHGEIVLAYYALGGHFWIFREVRAISSSPALADREVLTGRP